jgi:transposase InsO family protein
VDFDTQNLNDQQALWRHYYNWDRPHSAHNGKIANKHFIDLINETPSNENVSEEY